MALKDKLRSRSAADLREERDLLGFVRQPAVRWLEPALLAKTAVELIVSGTFGKFADKREIQRETQEQFDYSASPGELWIDYLSDTGDGWEATYTMAYLAAQPSLEVGDESLPRGQVLLLGGDQVYPTAEPETYEDRFKGPFACALPHSDPGREPHMYALPGNHDWYDGLVSFLRLFCTGGWIGGWKTRQRRSYFALALPNNWWVFAIDIQLDTYIDDVQLDYFRAQGIGPGDKVILLTAKPSWVKAYPGRVEPASWRYLSFFEERLIRDSGARLVMTVTGDLHHYARYEPSQAGAPGAPTRITAGGGGAYLSCTHTLTPALELQSLPRQTDSGEHEERPAVGYARERIYPSDKDSKALAKGIVRLATLNPGLAKFIGGFYALLGLAILGGLNSGAESLVANATQDGFIGFLASAASGMSLIVALVLFGAIFGGTDIKPPPLEQDGGVRLATALGRLAVALVHTALHLLLAGLVLWVVIKVVPEICAASIVIWLAGVPALFAMGACVGATVFGLFLFGVHKARGAKAPENANQVFSGQSIADYKNLLRMRLTPDGALTVYVLGVDRAGREWDHVGDDGPGPRFVPRRAAPKVRIVDGPLLFDPAGNPVS